MPTWTYSLCMNSSMDSLLCVLKPIIQLSVCSLFGCRNKPFKETPCLLKNTPVTVTELKEKVTEWLSCLTKTDMMETVILLLLGAGKKKGP